MRSYVVLALACAALAGCIVIARANPASDGAVIVDSGSTNTTGYRITIHADGSATIVLQNRGVAHGATKPFTVAGNVAAEFFANLKAARTANVSTLPCMKSASFGTTTRVLWHGWTSPDLDCPSDRGVLNALVASVNKIRAASGIGSLPRPGQGPAGGPLHVENAPSPSGSPPKRRDP